MIQSIDTLQLFGLLVLGLGIILIVAGCVAGWRSPEDSDKEARRESKGVILIGPIPIVWGFGRRGWLVAGAIGVILFLVWIIWLF
ncbi:MAG: TIGR00304 family membrane protein [Candidatus Thorarchaeota archaeon]